MHVLSFFDLFFFDAFSFFFFFQAEDGIRDVAVTGVQTCALPISRSRRQATPWARPAKFVFTIPIPVFTMPIRAFTFRRSRCSRWANPRVHDGPKSARDPRPARKRTEEGRSLGESYTVHAWMEFVARTRDASTRSI